MFNKLRTLISGVGLVFKYGDLASGIVKAWNSFPGLDADESILRKWLKSILLDASVLALLTKTPFDDTIVIGAIRLVDNDRVWTIIHTLAILARDGGVYKDGTLIPESEAYPELIAELDAASQEALPECPILINVAVGLLLFLLQQRFSKA